MAQVLLKIPVGQAQVDHLELARFGDVQFSIEECGPRIAFAQPDSETLGAADDQNTEGSLFLQLEGSPKGAGGHGMERAASALSEIPVAVREAKDQFWDGNGGERE